MADAVGGAEREHLKLEENVEKLRRSLRHWRTWDAEYEGLKEEMLALKDDASRDEPVGQFFGVELL